jgi:DNA-binding protein HU-beta
MRAIPARLAIPIFSLAFPRFSGYQSHRISAEKPSKTTEKGGKDMTKAELIEAMAEDAGITKAAASAALDSFIDGVTKALKKKDGKVTLVGFGTFQKTRRKARKGRNPQTGETIKIKASNVVKFKPGKKLKDAV